MGIPHSQPRRIVTQPAAKTLVPDVVIGILGPRKSGKSTIFNQIQGCFQQDSKSQLLNEKAPARNILWNATYRHLHDVCVIMLRSADRLRLTNEEIAAVNRLNSSLAAPTQNLATLLENLKILRGNPKFLGVAISEFEWLHFMIPVLIQDLDCPSPDPVAELRWEELLMMNSFFNYQTRYIDVKIDASFKQIRFIDTGMQNQDDIKLQRALFKSVNVVLYTIPLWEYEKGELSEIGSMIDEERSKLHDSSNWRKNVQFVYIVFTKFSSFCNLILSQDISRDADARLQEIVDEVYPKLRKPNTPCFAFVIDALSEGDIRRLCSQLVEQCYAEEI